VVALDNLSFDISPTYIQGATRYAAPVASQGGVWSDLVWGSYADYTTLPPDADGNPVSANDRGTVKPLHVFQEHLPSWVSQIESRRKYNRFTGSITANHSLGDWFTQRFIVGIDKVWDTDSQLFPLNPASSYPQSSGGEVFQSNPQEQNVTVDWAASGIYTMDDTWEFTTSIGAQYYYRQNETLGTRGREFSTSLQRTINQTNETQASLSYSFRENKQLGIYIQEQIGWRGIAFITGAVRADDNSAFGSGFDLEYYPKVSGTVVVSDMDFWNVDMVNQLRLRAAWGKAGRQPGTFSGLNLYEAFPGPGGAAGITPDSPGNELVGPEVSTEIEVGVDFAFFDDVVSGEFTFFSQVTRGALINRGLPGSVGFPGSVQTNLGKLANQGWEAVLNFRVLDMENVRFDLTVAGDHTINEIKNLGDVPESGDLRVGHPYPTHRGNFIVSAEHLGADDSGFYTNAMCDSGISDGPFPGNVLRPGGTPVACNITDVDMQERIDNLLYGIEYPTYTFNVAPTVTLFNNLQIFANAEGQYGRWQYNIETAYGNIYRNTLASWLKDDPIYLAGSLFGPQPDRRYYGMVSADYWKLRELGMRYQLPQSLLGGAVDRASISVTGRDLFMLWQRTDVDLAGSKIYDVEQTSTNIWAFPNVSRIDVTLRVTL
jgi:hypothetical protein